MERSDDTDEAAREDVTLVRSEEELVTRRERRAVERVRVRKVVVEEERMVPVVVRREELRVEREAIADGDDPGDDPRAAAPELVAELVLHSEEIEVVTRVVPRERVRILRVREVAEQEVTAELRRERIEVEEAGRS